MHKKIIMTCMAIAALAVFAAPSAIAAQLKEGGTAISPGASITGRSTSQVLITATGGITFACTSTHVVGTVTKNNGTVIEGEVPVGGLELKGTGAGEDCTSSLGAFKPTMTTKWCLRIGAGTDSGTMTGCGGPINFSVDITGITTCKYQTASVSGTIATAPNDAEVIGSEQPVTGESTNSFICPAGAKFDTTWVMTTTDGTTLQFTT
ncbi:MAG: hypothetical protein ACTHKT_00225 [Solirubrobacterales bacterium]